MTPRTLRQRTFSATLLLAALAGCGGGGSPAPAPAATPVPAPGASGPVAAAPPCALQYTLTASPVLAGADPLLAQQWHLRNTGQAGGLPGEDLRAVDAWASTRGEGVRITVIDDSVEVTHPDLRPNLVEGASKSYRPGNPNPDWPLPCSADDSHGTAVAGIALARDGNATGGSGVAPRSTLVAYDALSSSLDVDIADALTRDGAASPIYHNSWGAPDDGGLHPPEAAFIAAIEQGITSGRAGKGAVYVFSAGNGGLRDNSNYDGYVNQRGVIAVCAVDDTGRRPSYGEPGANVTVCAPSSGGRAAITTTALQGTDRNDFTGTSASAPMVSGVAALMLSANPALSWRDVRLILARTARQNDPNNAGWQNSALGNGARFNHAYGYGVVDANAAVQAAKTWTSVGTSADLRTCEFSRTPNLAIPDAVGAAAGAAVSDSAALTGCAISRIEFVQVVFTSGHSYSGDLRIRLTSPAGTVSQLAEPRTCAGACGTYADWTFGSVRHLDETASGTWTLQVTDAQADDTGTFQRWSLRVYGR